METKNTSILDEQLVEVHPSQRRSLLPWWIKVFTWMFLISGSMTPLGIVAGLLGFPVSLSLYGLITKDPFSMVGIFLVILYTVKGITAWGLWMQKDWGVYWAITDSILGIFLCTYFMSISTYVVGGFQIRFELLFLIPYLVRVWKIREKWKAIGVKVEEEGREEFGSLGI